MVADEICNHSPKSFLKHPKAPENGWLEDDPASFFGGFILAYFQVRLLLVSGRAPTFQPFQVPSHHHRRTASPPTGATSSPDWRGPKSPPPPHAAKAPWLCGDFVFSKEVLEASRFHSETHRGERVGFGCFFCVGHDLASPLRLSKMQRMVKKGRSEINGQILF